MRAKVFVLGGIAVSGALSLLAGSQPWFEFSVGGGATESSVTGHEVNSALSPISVAIIAAALVLTIAGSVFRRVLGVLTALLGAGVVAIAVTALGDPQGAVSGKVAELTGLTGESAEAGDIAGTPWVYVVAASGLLAVVLGVVALLRGGRWGATSRKYESTSAAGRPLGGTDRISDWDALSGGDDPTADVEEPDPR